MQQEFGHLDGGETESDSQRGKNVSRRAFYIAAAICVLVGFWSGVGVYHFVDNNPNLVESPLSPLYDDADEDGLSDVAEKNHPLLEDGDPDRRDVFVEIDYEKGAKPSAETLELTREAFAELDVSNPDGSTGVDVHFVVDDELPARENTSHEHVEENIKPKHADYDGYGYHYVVMVNEVPDSSDNFSTLGQATFGTSVVESNDQAATTLIHELGHSVGLGGDVFEGIDSIDLACDENEYRSVMNYRCLSPTVGFSDGGEFNDGHYLEDNQFTPSTTNLDKKYFWGALLP